MKNKELHGFMRAAVRKGEARELRRAGKIPAVMYGHSEPRSLYIDEHEFRTNFHTISENTIILLHIDGESFEVFVKDFQEEIISGKIQHIDFFEFERGKLLRTHVPVHLHGVAEGVKLGGILETFVHDLEVECLPKDLPEDIVVDISALEVGDSVHVEEIQIPDGVRVLNSQEQVVAIVTHIRVQEEVVEEPVEGEEEIEEEVEQEEE